MEIEIHDLYVVIHGMARRDVEIMCNAYLDIPFKSFKKNEYRNTLNLKYAFGKAKESAFIGFYDGTDKTQLKIHLHGSYFDNVPNFRLRRFLKFIKQYGYTFKQLDLAFNDDKKCLTEKNIIHWCSNSDDFCTGNLVKDMKPKVIYVNNKFYCVQLGSAKSNTNFGTIYIRPDTGFIRIETKLRDPNKIEYVLEKYSDKNRSKFETKSKETLVDCINFITGQSKKNGKADKYKKLPPYAAFLESEVKRLNWSEIKKERQKNRVTSDKISSETRIRRASKMVDNMMENLQEVLPLEEIVRIFTESSAYTLNKK